MDEGGSRVCFAAAPACALRPLAAVHHSHPVHTRSHPVHTHHVLDVGLRPLAAVHHSHHVHTRSHPVHTHHVLDVALCPLAAVHHSAPSLRASPEVKGPAIPLVTPTTGSSQECHTQAHPREFVTESLTSPLLFTPTNVGLRLCKALPTYFSSAQQRVC